jgi:hypothetical protein
MVRKRDALVAAWAVAAILVVSWTGGCGGGKSDFDPSASSGTGDDASVGGGSGSSSSSGSGSSSGGGTFEPPDASGDGGACMGLMCSVPKGCTTSLSGTVYDPAGANPLYNVVVFVPNDPAGSLPAIQLGTDTCSSCDVSIGDYVAATTSDANGNFKLVGVPAASKVPLVVQIGKWRREVFLPQVKACTNNVLMGSDSTRLPKNHTEGDIPQMALVTGSADNLGCFLEGVGLDPAEYSAPHAGGRLDIYRGLAQLGGRGGGGAGAPGLSTGATAGDCSTDNPNCVWNSKANLEKYDIVLLSCEGNPYDPDDPDSNMPTNKTATSKAALRDWLNEGGKAFATHYQYTWFKNSPSTDFQMVATWLGSSGGDQTGNYDIDTTFPKGKVFNQWLSNVKALTGGKIALSQVANSVSTVNAPETQRWIYDDATTHVKYLSFVTPLGGIPMTDGGGETTGQYCGKAVFSDLHAGGDPAGDIPMNCSGPPLSAQLKALEFLFFDLSACVSNDGLPPPPPPQPAK